MGQLLVARRALRTQVPRGSGAGDRSFRSKHCTKRLLIAQTPHGLPSLALPPMERPHLHPVAANPHIAPTAPVSLARVVEEEPAIGIGASADKRQTALAK